MMLPLLRRCCWPSRVVLPDQGDAAGAEWLRAGWYMSDGASAWMAWVGGGIDEMDRSKEEGNKQCMYET
jgi:hypothetical protein